MKEYAVMDPARVTEGLRQIFEETFHLDTPAPDVDLVETGILDSFQLVELLVQLEKKFGVQVDIEDLDLDDLRTIERIGANVLAKAVSQAETRGMSARVAG
jgi:D-alanine--poly(phosphoribitol) ligase subunit 2